MTDENPQDPKGDKKVDEQEQPRSTTAEPSQESAQSAAEKAGLPELKSEKPGGEPEKPRFTIVVPGLASAQQTAEFAGWAGFNSEKNEGEPEKYRLTGMEPGLGSAQGAAEFAGWAGFNSEKKEGEPEKHLFNTALPGLASAKETPEVAGWAGFKNDKKEGEPEKLLFNTMEPRQASAQGTPEVADKAGLKSEKKEEEPEKLLFDTMEPGQASAEGTPEVADKAGFKSKKKEEEPEKRLFSTTELRQTSDQDTPEVADKAGLKSEKKEEETEKPRNSEIEPVQKGDERATEKAGEPSPSGETTEARSELPSYEIMEPPPEPQADFAKFDLTKPTGTNADAAGQIPGSGPAIPGQPPAQAAIGAVKRPGQNSARVYILAVVGLGLIFGCIIAFLSWRAASPEGPYDLGPVTSSGAGLRGHLYTKWDKKLEYRLSFEPSVPGQLAGFALAVAHPPRPLSVEIHLLDAQGFVLCSREVLLKYDGGAPALAAATPNTPAGNASGASSSGDPPAHGMQDLAAAQEAERELGKDVFKNEIGPDGQISAIDAQGEVPCSEKAYTSTISWNFTTNFPSLAEQAELGKQPEEAAADNEESQPVQHGARPRRKANTIPAPVLLPFSIEGDDAIVEFDVARGVIETRDKKIFFAGKASGNSADPQWQDYPVSIHYRCDQTASCVLSHAGLGVMRVRLSR
jgi:hypothetical protein